MEKFCARCKTELIDGVCPKCVQERNEYEEKIKRFFMSPNEKFLAVLGGANSQEYIMRGKCSGGFALVSDKRLYFLGKSYDICHNVFGQKGPRENKQSKTIDLKDVTGTGDSIYRQSHWLVMSILHLALMIICIITVIIRSPEHAADESQAYLWLLSYMAAPILFIFMLIYLVLHLTTKFHMLTVQYNGGEIAFDMASFPEQEIIFFQRQLRLAKDKATEDNNTIKKDALKEAVSSVIQSAPQSSKVGELAKLADLLSKGVISQEDTLKEIINGF